MAQQNDRKILRIGVIQNSKIIEERLLRKRETVSIGQSPKNTFVLPLASLPKRYPLFELKGGVYYLNFTESMNGRVSVEDAVLDFRAVREQKLATARRDFHSIALSERSRGKVVMGEVTLLFQFVAPPPPPSRLQLPANVRGRWFKQIDWAFVAILLGSCITQVSSVVFVTAQDYPEVKGIEAIPDRFVEFVQKEAPKAKIKEKLEDMGKESDDGEKAAKEKEEKKAPPKRQPKPETAEASTAPTREISPEEKARAKAAKLRRMQKKVKGKTILKFIGTTGGEGEGNIVDSLAGGAADVKIKHAFRDTSGVVVADGKDRDRRGSTSRTATGTVAGVSDKDLRMAKGPGQVKTGKKGPERQIKGKLKVANPTEAIGTGMLDKAAVSKVVRRRQGALKNCYEKRLKRLQKLAGKVMVQITILGSGRVGNVQVTQNTTGDSALVDCIRTNIKRWRFPKPDGGSVTFGFPFIFSPST